MHLRTRILFLAVGVIVPAILLSACALNLVSFKKTKPLTPTSMVIYSAMTRNYEGAGGVLNLYVDTDGFPNVLTPTSGQEKKELTATLWLVITDRPETYTSFQVQTGQTISFEGYDIKILRIGGSDREGYFVEIDVSEVE